MGSHASVQRRVAAVCVGVDRPGLLRDLNDAAGGAKRFHDWVGEQRRFGVEVLSGPPLTDAAGGSVSRVQVLRAVKEAVAKNVDVLYLYFAGHGIAGGYTETLLLSDAANDPNDAVNIGTAFSDALYCGIAHVVIVYDACRSKPNTPALTAVQGGSIFSGIPKSQRKKHVDTFYACALGESAFETVPAGGNGPPEAFFTNTLLELLRSPKVSMLAIAAQEDGSAVTVIPCAPLERFLENEVPKIAARRVPAFDQSPEVDVLSAMPEYFAVVPAPAAATDDGLLGAPGPAPAAGRSPRKRLSSHVASVVLGVPKTGRPYEPLEDLLQAPEVRDAGPEFHAFIDAAAQAVGRGGYETHTGLSVRGIGVRGVTVSNNPPVTSADSHSPGATHWRIGNQPWDARPGSALVEFEDGSGTVVAVMPGFESTLVVKRGGVQALSYAPTRHTEPHAMYEQFEPRLRAQRMAATALLGTARLHELVRRGGKALADDIRNHKAIDPMLGLLAAYAYRLAGEQKEIESIFGYMANTWSDHHFPPRPVPFDVAMLAGRATRAFAATVPGLAPMCPMLSLGWLDLADRVPGLHPAVLAAGRHRRNSLWTTFEPEGLAMLAEAIRRGELR